MPKEEMYTMRIKKRSFNDDDACRVVVVVVVL